MSDKDKETFEKNFKKYFSEYLDQSKLEKRIPSYKYLNDELHKLDADCTESSYKKVMQKKILLKSENAKKFCRNGIPLKYLKEFVKKLFYIDFSKNDYENKKLEVLKGKDISLFKENIPYFTNKSFEESVPVNFLNEKGLEALKEICCLLSNVLQRIEYSPLIIKLSSLLLLFFTKEETYEIMRNLIELSYNSFEIENIRWHFRFNQEGNMKIVYSITQSILTLSDIIDALPGGKVNLLNQIVVFISFVLGTINSFKPNEKLTKALGYFYFVITAITIYIYFALQLLFIYGHTILPSLIKDEKIVCFFK